MRTNRFSARRSTECARHLREPLGHRPHRGALSAGRRKGCRAEQLNQTWLTQPALFAIEYALAQWWMSLGIEPAAMAGHSIGEYVAACLAGVFSLEDALAIVAARGRLIYDLPAGRHAGRAAGSRGDPASMVTLSLAAINNPAMCVVSGPDGGDRRLRRVARRSNPSLAGACLLRTPFTRR